MKVPSYVVVSDGINTAKNYLVSNGRRVLLLLVCDAGEDEGPELDERVPDYNTPESELMNRQIVETVNAAMEQLPEELRVAITLRELEGSVMRIFPPP